MHARFRYKLSVIAITAVSALLKDSVLLSRLCVDQKHRPTVLLELSFLSRNVKNNMLVLTG